MEDNYHNNDCTKIPCLTSENVGYEVLRAAWGKTKTENHFWGKIEVFPEVQDNDNKLSELST